MSNLEEVTEKLISLNQELETIQALHKHISKSIEEITKDINRLQLSANSHNQEEDNKPKSRILTLEACKSLLGERVHVLNPKRGEPNEGVIYKVGRVFVTVKLTNNETRKRIPSNLRLITP